MVRHSVLSFISGMIMAQITNATYVMQIIFVQFFLLTVINARYWSPGNATNYETLRTLGRSRRSPFHRYIPPDTLTATIKDGDREIHLTWKRAERYLVNENLPVYLARINKWGPNHMKSDVMKDIGNFRMYHDIAHKSAIIYLENIDKIHGVVGSDYDIFDLPIHHLCRPLVVGGKFVRRLPYLTHDGRTHLDPIPEYFEHNDEVKRGIDLEQSIESHSENRQRLTPVPFYMETLLFVTHDVVQYIGSQLNGEFLYTLIMNYLLHFNAVDMIYAKLLTEDFDININLAGIIIEEEDGVFSEITKYQPLMYKNQAKLDISYIFQHFQWYPNHFDFPFTKDSFDLILISTGRELKFAWKNVKSWHSGDTDIFAKRWENDGSSSAPMIIVRSISPFSSYCIVAHQIGKILGMEKKGFSRQGIPENKIQCHDLMQRSKLHCTGCMKWSDESISQLKKFLSGNRNRCFFLNKPRSLYPPGTPIISQTPCRQCACFGYNSYGMETADECPRYIPSDTCDEPLQCKYEDVLDQLQLESIILPLDGTPCGENKVCWEEECRSLN